MFKAFKKWLSLAALILSVMGVVTFSLFILEESFQTAMFGTWPAKNAGRWDLVQIGTDTMQRAINTIKIVNYSIGWIQPLAFISYRSYAISAQTYVDSLNAEAFANAPDLFVGRTVTMRFKPIGVDSTDNGDVLLTNGSMGIVLTQSQYTQATGHKFYHIKGVLMQYNAYYIVDISDNK